MSDNFEQREKALEAIILHNITAPRKEAGLNYINVCKQLAALWGVSPSSMEVVTKLENAYEILRIADYALTHSKRAKSQEDLGALCQHLADYMAFLGRTDKQRKIFFDEVKSLAPNMVYCESAVQAYRSEEGKKSRPRPLIRTGGNHHRMIYAE